MANDVKLQESHPVDENLRPLKVNDKSTSLELANNGARVTGDLEVTGDIYGSSEKMYLNNRVESYWGTLLGYTKIRNDDASMGQDVIQLSTSMAVLQTAQGTDFSITFTAPPSGCVEINLSCLIYASSREFTFSLSDDATYSEVNARHTYNAYGVKPDESDFSSVFMPFSVTGLTSGNTYTYYIAGKVSSNYGFIYQGADRTGNYTQPILIKAIALPPQSVMTTGE